MTFRREKKEKEEESLRKVVFYLHQTYSISQILLYKLKFSYWKMTCCAHESVCTQTHAALDVGYGSEVPFDSLYLLTICPTADRCLGLE